MRQSSFATIDGEQRIDLSLSRDVVSKYDDIKIVADNIEVIEDVSDILLNDDFLLLMSNISNVLTVAGMESEIASIIADKDTLDSLFNDKAILDSIYADKATLDSLFADKAKLDSLFSDKAVLDSLYADKTTLDRIYASINNIDTTVNNIANIDTVATSIANVDTVAANDTNISKVAAVDTAVSAVAAIDTDVATIAGIDTEISTVSGIAPNVTTVAAVDGEVVTVAGISGDVTTVAGISSDVTAVATTVVPNIAEILLADDNAAIATAQAGIATTKASEASASATASATSASEALGYRNEAEAFADSINPDNLVNITTAQTIAGTKTFTSSPIVPTPTTDFQSVPLRSTNITVYVGAGQTYTTINQALEYLSGFYPMYKQSGITATIRLKAGFVMAEQVLVSGIDLGWITVSSEDAEVNITHTALTTAFEGRYPAFGVNKGGTLPYIKALFNMNYGAGVGNTAENKDGIYAHGAGSSANIGDGKGVLNAGSYGIHATKGALINGYVTRSSGAGYYGVAASFNATVTVYALYADACGVCGVNASQGGKINCTSAKIQNQTTGINCIRVQYGSTIEASYVDITGSTVTVFSQAVNTLTGEGIIYQ